MPTQAPCRLRRKRLRRNRLPRWPPRPSPAWPDSHTQNPKPDGAEWRRTRPEAGRSVASAVYKGLDSRFGRWMRAEERHQAARRKRIDDEHVRGGGVGIERHYPGRRIDLLQRADQPGRIAN